METSTAMIDIGVCSYRNPEKLKRTLDTIRANTVQPFLLRVWHNTSEDAESNAALRAMESFPIDEIIESPNVGYAGAVNGLLARSTAPYFLYCDNDIEVRTRGWDVRMMEVLEANPEVAQVFPGSGHYGFHNGRYHECLWNAGYCWMISQRALHDLGAFESLVGMNHKSAGFPMDQSLGHHDEVDLMVRLRMAGFQLASVPEVQVLHHATATNSPESEMRIRAGVIRWMNKHNRYFCGAIIRECDPDDPNSSYDPRALRYTDWPPCALYLERWTLAQFPHWNTREANDMDVGYRVVETTAGEMDAIEVLKPKGCYRGRAI